MELWSAFGPNVTVPEYISAYGFTSMPMLMVHTLHLISG